MVNESPDPIAALRACSDPLEFEFALEQAVAHADSDERAASLAQVLLEHAHRHDDAKTGYLAAEALHALTALVLTQAVDVKLDLALLLRDVSSEDDLAFALQAARSAGLLYAHWTDSALQDALTTCLEKLAARPDVGADALVELAHAQLVDALNAEDIDALRAGLLESQKRFAAVFEDEPDRVDAEFMGAILEAIRGFNLGGPADAINAAAQRAEDAIAERGLYGRPEALPMLSRRASENSWLRLAQTAAELSPKLDEQTWLEGGTVIGLVLDAVEQSRAVRISVPGDLNATRAVVPRLQASLARNMTQRQMLLRVIDTTPLEPDRLALARSLITEEPPLPKGEGSGDPLRAVLGPIVAEQLAESLSHEELADVTARLSAFAGPRVQNQDVQWADRYDAILSAFAGHPDYEGHLKGAFAELVGILLDFVSLMLRTELSAAGGAYKWLGNPEAKEAEMADTLAEYIHVFSGGTVNTEVRHHGAGGRVDILVELGPDRIVIECKRDAAPTAVGRLDPYIAQTDRYLTTSVRIGVLAVLDLSDKSLGPVRGMDSSAWVVDVQAADPASPERKILCIVVPGNRKATPSAVGKNTPRGVSADQ